MDRGNRIRILCVAGDRRIQRRLQASLETDFEVAAAPNGLQGLARLAAGAVDWVLLDCGLGDMTAEKFLLSAYRQGSHPGFILVAGSPISRLDRESMRPLGVRGITDRAFDPDFLRAVILTGGRLKGSPVGGPTVALPSLLRI